MNNQAIKRLADAAQAIEAIERFTADIALDNYLENELLQAAVERKFEILGEALKGLRSRTQPGRHDSRSTGNHQHAQPHHPAYDAVDQRILWDAIHEDMTQLKQGLDALISEE